MWCCQRSGEEEICGHSSYIIKRKPAVSGPWSNETLCTMTPGAWCRHGLARVSLCCPKRFLGADQEVAQTPAGIFPVATLVWMRGFNSTEVSCCTASLHVRRQFWRVQFTISAVTSVSNLWCPSNGLHSPFAKMLPFLLPLSWACISFCLRLLGWCLSSMDRRQAWVQMPAWDYCRAQWTAGFSCLLLPLNIPPMFPLWQLSACFTTKLILN